jgi:aminoglycoside phosphotransferase (APT) family kinase protein
MLLAHDTYGQIPDHAAALDVGCLGPGDSLRSLGDAGEFYLLTRYQPGRPYAEDLRRVATRGRCNELDLQRAGGLAGYLADLHASAPPAAAPLVYRRAIRDLLGSGEGIFGIVDAYGPDVPGASPARLQALEARCLDWRWRLRGQTHRLRRTHGDFHPFNVVFEDGDRRPRLLDASRGCAGDPADDVSCMGINYLFFALDQPLAWDEGLGPLWTTFWSTYLERTGDRELLKVAPPFLAWRALVLCCPRWYPDLSAAGRDRLLGVVERALAEGHFDPAWAQEVLR